MNVAHDRAIKVQIADQIGRVARRERGIDIKTVPGRIIVFLRDVDLRIGYAQRAAQRENENATMKVKASYAREAITPAPFTTAHPLFVKDLRQHNGGAKVTAIIRFRGSG